MQRSPLENLGWRLRQTTDLYSLSVEARLKMIQELNDETWVDDSDERQIIRLWESFGPQLPEIAGAHLDLFRESVNEASDLKDISLMASLRRGFEADTKGLARQFLTDNRAYVTAQLGRLGLAVDGAAAADTSGRTDAVEDIRRDAQIVARALEAQRLMRTRVVGSNLAQRELPIGGVHEDFVPATFDPNQPPTFGPEGDEDPPLASWENTKVQYDQVAALIAGVTGNNPAVFAAVRNDDLASLTSSDPDATLRAAETSLRGVLGDIDATVPKVNSNQLDYRDLVPIHSQLFSGTTQAPSRTDWTQPFAQYVAKEVLSDHEATEFWISLGLGTLAAAAFVVAELATAGSATFFIAAGVGLGAGAVQAGRSWSQYMDMAQAARATVSDERSVLSQGQASAALMQAVLDSAFLFLDAYSVGAKGARAVAGEASRRAVTREAAEQAEREVAELAKKETAQMVGGRAEAAGGRAGAEAAKATAEQGLLQEAPVRLGAAEHTLKLIKSGGRAALWLCSDCAQLVSRVDEILGHLGETDALRQPLNEILANAKSFESRALAGEIGQARLTRETNALATQLTNLSRANPQIEGLMFFRTFLAGSDEAARIIGDQVVKRLEGELGREGFVQVVRDLGPDAVRNLSDLAGTELRDLIQQKTPDLIRWLGDGGLAGGVEGLTGAQAKALMNQVPDALLNQLRSGRARISSKAVQETVAELGQKAVQEMYDILGDKLTGNVLQQFRRWEMFTIDPALAKIVANNGGQAVRSLPRLQGKTLIEIEDALRAAGMRGPKVERGMRVWTHADGSVARIKVGAKALKGARTTPHIVLEISDTAGRYADEDIIAKVTDNGSLISSGGGWAQNALTNWYRRVTGKKDVPTKVLARLVDIWADASHIGIVR